METNSFREQRNLTQPTTEIADTLWRVGAIKFGKFRLKLHEKNPDAPLSPVYVDLRVMRSFPRDLSHAVDLLASLVRNLNFDCVADVPTAATPLTTLLSAKLNVPMISPRLDRKTHGSGSTIEGIFRSGQRVLVIDDLITTADSKLEVVEVLRSHNLSVEDTAVLLDREQGGLEVLRRAGVRLHAAATLAACLDWYLLQHRVSDAQHAEVVAYLRGSPQAQPPDV